jgi:uncharacterized protein YcfJ
MKEKNVKVLKMTVALMIGSAIAAPAMADDTYYDTARVLSVVPQTERVNMPRQDCHTEYEQVPAANSGSRDIGGSIIGGIAGGLIGSQIGKGKGRIAGAAVGAATGAIVGDRIDNSDRDHDTYSTQPVARCVTVDNWQTVNRGYQVTYRYNGRTYTTMMPNDPGDSISVRVAVVPEVNPRVTYNERRDDRDWRRDDDRRDWGRRHDGRWDD